MAVSRRAFVRTLPAAAGLAACGPARPSTPDAAFAGQDPRRGHLLRRSRAPIAPARAVRTKVVVVGAGAAGAAAAWHLARAGLSDFFVLELEDETGGTARGGTLPAGRHPMGAHYLPLPPPSARPLYVLLRELGIVVGGPDHDPLLDGRWVAPAPLERHRVAGLWRDGVVPLTLGNPGENTRAFERFLDHLRGLAGRAAGSDGRPLFAFPVGASSRDLRHLDRIDFATYLKRCGLSSPTLDWYADYACRDDYGLPASATSAFAGLHHFLARGVEEDRGTRLVVFPEGNHRLVSGMLEAVPADRLLCGHVVTHVDPGGSVVALNVREETAVRFTADAVLWAAPRFVLTRVLPPGTDPLRPGDVTYTPWRVTAFEVDRAPGGVGAPLAWDNVDVEADHLGYVVAGHGRPPRPRDQRSEVLVLYEPFDAVAPGALADARRRLLSTPLPQAVREVTAALASMHPGLEPSIRRIRIARWGHAMVRPVPGFLFGAARARAQAPVGRVRPCAADVSGLPLFEQAFAAGTQAAAWALRGLGMSPDPALAWTPA